MGCAHSSLGTTYDGGGEVWQRQPEWRPQQSDGAGLQPTRQQLYGFSEPSPLQQHAPQVHAAAAPLAPHGPQEPAYPQPESEDSPTEPPPQLAAGALTKSAETRTPSPTDVSEERDHFPVEQRPAPMPPSEWKKGELIGAGAFGRVYLGLNEESGELMAVKQVTISKEEAVAGRVAQHVRDLEKEVNVLKMLHHPNIVRYLGTESSKDCLNIFLEYVPGGSIASLLSKFGSFRESVIRIYTRQILLGLQYLHDNRIMHRDIKGANILVDKSGLVKLADFGASKEIEDLVTIDMGVKSIKGTSYWMAPEVIKQTGHGRAADIWSVGCTIMEMATGKPPWSQFSSQLSAMFHIARAQGPPPIPDHLSPAAKDFLLLCLNRVASERPSAQELLQHAFVAVPGAARVPGTPPQKADAPVAAPLQQAHSPGVGEPERPARRGRAAGGMPNVGGGSADFLKLYSPMADAGHRMAEAATRSRPGSSTGERGRTWADEGVARSEDGPLRQSVASHASSRYRNAAAAAEPLGSPQASTSDSDYNPVEEPAWAAEAGASYDLGASPPGSPRIPAFGMHESTAVASPARRGAKAGLPRGGGGGGDGGMEEIVSFVRDKAQKDTLRLSRSFAPREAPASEWPAGSRQRQWEAELQAELAQQRRQRTGLAA